MRATTTPALLERDRELRGLEAAVAAALDGRGGSVVLHGPAGIGKTALLRAAVEVARTCGARAVVAHGSEFERGFAFGVVRQLLEPLVAEVPETERDVLFAGAAGFAREALAPSGGQDPTAGDTAFATLHGLYWLCVNLADRAPLVLAVDDLQWADGASLRWLAFLARRLEGLRVLLVATQRADAPGEHHDEAEELVLVHRLADVVRPAALSPGAVGVLVEHELEGATPDAAFVAACHDATRGNPLFLRELLGTMRQDGVAPTARSAARVEAVGPRAVARIVLARLAALGEGAERLARAAALVGDGADPELVRGVAELDRAAFADAAHRLAGAELVDVEPEVEFAHPVSRAAIVAAIAPAERADLSRRAVALLAARGDVEAVASHLLAVPPAGEAHAVDVLRRAGRRALARGAPETAVALLQRALAEPPSAADEADVLHELGVAALRTHAAAAPVHLRAALDRIPAGPERAARADDLAHALNGLNRPREALEVAEEVLREVEAGPGRQRLLARTAELARVLGDHDTVVATIARAEAEITDPGLLARVRATGAYDAMLAGAPADQVAAQARQALAGGALSADTSSGSMPLFLGCMALAAAGDVDAATSELNRAIETARRRGSMVSYAGTLAIRARLRQKAGDLRGAEDDCRENEALGVGGMPRPYATAWLLESLVSQGRLDEAEEVVRTRALDAELPGFIVFNPLLHARGRLRIAQGRLEEGLADVLLCGERQEAVGASNPADLPWRGTAAQALHALGRADEAEAMSAAHLAAARGFGAPVVVAEAARVRAAVVGGEEGAALAAEAVALLGDTGPAVERAAALLVHGRLLHAAGDAAEARRVLQDARALAEASDARPLTDAATEAALAAGARPRRATTRGSAGLTPAERRTAEQAAAGLSNREIAQASFVTEKTVEGHLSGAYRKLGITSRAQLASALESAASG